jgi:hypothetical protein
MKVDAVRNEQRASILEHPGSSLAIGVLDESSFPKRGKPLLASIGDTIIYFMA